MGDGGVGVGDGGNLKGSWEFCKGFRLKAEGFNEVKTHRPHFAKQRLLIAPPPFQAAFYAKIARFHFSQKSFI